MTMHLTHDGAPGHVADANQFGWACSCGAGNTWEDERPRSRGAGGARRHLTAAARNNPEYRVDIAAAVAEDETPEPDTQDTQDTPAETPEPESEPDPPMTYAERLRQANEAATATRAQFSGGQA